MSDAADFAVAEDPTDNLDCFNFALLLDDVSLSNKRQRKQSMMTDDQQIDGSTGGLDQGSRRPIGARVQQDRQANEWETRSECAEPRKFNIWGDHKVGRDSLLVAQFAGRAIRKMSNHRTSNIGISYTDSKAARLALELLDDDEEESPAEKPSFGQETQATPQETPAKPAASVTSQRKKLQFSKNDGYYPRDFEAIPNGHLQGNGATTTYRKLSYQETSQVHREAESVVDIRARLNLDILFNFSPMLNSPTSTGQTKLAHYVRDDIHGLLQGLGDLLNKRLQSKEQGDFPNPLSVFSSQLQASGAVVNLAKKH